MQLLCAGKHAHRPCAAAGQIKKGRTRTRGGRLPRAGPRPPTREGGGSVAGSEVRQPPPAQRGPNEAAARGGSGARPALPWCARGESGQQNYLCEGGPEARGSGWDPNLVRFRSHQEPPPSHKCEPLKSRVRDAAGTWSWQTTPPQNQGPRRFPSPSSRVRARPKKEANKGKRGQ
jgi:hypothetical protein